jgi:hypothetical protein
VVTVVVDPLSDMAFIVEALREATEAVLIAPATPVQVSTPEVPLYPGLHWSRVIQVTPGVIPVTLLKVIEVDPWE